MKCACLVTFVLIWASLAVIVSTSSIGKCIRGIFIREHKCPGSITHLTIFLYISAAMIIVPMIYLLYTLFKKPEKPEPTVVSTPEQKLHTPESIALLSSNKTSDDLPIIPPTQKAQEDSDKPDQKIFLTGEGVVEGLSLSSDIDDHNDIQISKSCHIKLLAIDVEQNVEEEKLLRKKVSELQQQLSLALIRNKDLQRGDLEAQQRIKGMAIEIEDLTEKLKLKCIELDKVQKFCRSHVKVKIDLHKENEKLKRELDTHIQSLEQMKQLKEELEKKTSKLEKDIKKHKSLNVHVTSSSVSHSEGSIAAGPLAPGTLKNKKSCFPTASSNSQPDIATDSNRQSTAKKDLQCRHVKSWHRNNSTQQSNSTSEISRNLTNDRKSSESKQKTVKTPAPRLRKPKKEPETCSIKDVPIKDTQVIPQSNTGRKLKSRTDWKENKSLIPVTTDGRKSHESADICFCLNESHQEQAASKDDESVVDMVQSTIMEISQQLDNSGDTKKMESDFLLRNAIKDIDFEITTLLEEEMNVVNADSEVNEISCSLNPDLSQDDKSFFSDDVHCLENIDFKEEESQHLEKHYFIPESDKQGSPEKLIIKIESDGLKYQGEGSENDSIGFNENTVKSAVITLELMGNHEDSRHHVTPVSSYLTITDVNSETKKITSCLNFEVVEERMSPPRSEGSVRIPLNIQPVDESASNPYSFVGEDTDDEAYQTSVEDPHLPAAPDGATDVESQGNQRVLVRRYSEWDSQKPRVYKNLSSGDIHTSSSTTDLHFQSGINKNIWPSASYHDSRIVTSSEAFKQFLESYFVEKDDMMSTMSM